VSCQFASIMLGRVALLPPTLEVTLVLSKLAYVPLCRSIQLLVLLARGDATKDLTVVCWLRWQVEVEWPASGNTVKQPVQLGWRPLEPQ
jgi:hypothetical protein